MTQSPLNPDLGNNLPTYNYNLNEGHTVDYYVNNLNKAVDLLNDLTGGNSTELNQTVISEIYQMIDLKITEEELERF